MRSLLSLFVLGAGVTAQGLSPAKPMPLPPVTGDWKTAAEPVAKTAPDADSAVPAAQPAAAPFAAKAPAGLRTGAVAAALREQLATSLLVDTPRAGEHWVRGANYKAGFDRRGFEFFAAPAAATLPAPHATFRLQEVQVGGRALAVGDATPELHAHEVRWSRGGVVESVALGRGGVEQAFTFAELPARGALELVIAVDAAGGVSADGGLQFADGAIHYGAAVAIDARGDRVPALTTLRDGAIAITVPAWFVEQAALPLVVDPLVSNTVAATSNLDLSNADLVWDSQDQTWMVVYESRFAANDTDVLVQRLSPAGALVGSLVAVDLTGLVWQRPAIANLQLYHRNLVVAQVSVDDVAPFWIGGRVLEAAGALATAQFDVERASVANHATGDKVRPDVGGDPALAGPTYFTVVWERVFSATDHDIHMKQVTFDGQLRAAAPTMVANSGANQSWPSIAKADGPPPFADQRFLVVFQQTFGVGDEDVHGALLSWDGQVRPVNGNNTFPIATGIANDQRPRASSPTAASGLRHFLVAYERTTAGNGQIAATLLTHAGSVVAHANLSQMAPAVPTAWPQAAPSVDCDGVRFAVAHHYLFGSSTLDWDVRAILVAREGATLAVHESSVLVASSQPERSPSIASVYSCTGQHTLGYAVVEERDEAATSTVFLQAYRGSGPAIIGTRPTGCGNVTLARTSGLGSVGETTQFQVAGAPSLLGVLVGLPATQWTPACPSCTMGVDGSALLGDTYNLTLPGSAVFAGITLSVQGFAFSGGPCLGSVALSDTIDLTLR
ncbi:MAG: hypothetical protein JNK49_10220 [Planctomycetes bacterium]|nr:hypothetical protein [Planctomycetota bacterium]